jgi:plasmid stabilization system protein ParE
MPRNNQYKLHPEAQREIEETYVWYSRRSLDTAIGFLTEIDHALDVVVKNPNRWPEYLYKTHRYLVADFPFSIVYLDDPDAVKIIAVAHHKRRPGYWKGRL